MDPWKAQSRASMRKVHRQLFKTVLDAAKAVLADQNATQSAVTNATAQLVAAMNTFKTRLIKEIAAVNLIGFWKMNGNAADSSGKGHHGTLTTGAAYYGAGTPTLTADRFGRANMAYHFDNGGNINVPHDPAFNPQQMTISVWVKKEAPATRTINPRYLYDPFPEPLEWIQVSIARCK
jgi:hypothetical protein